MNIADSGLQLGPYTIQQRQEPDRQWPLWWVFLGSALIGKSFSRPDLGCCDWLERQQRYGTFYAYSSAKLPEFTVTNGTRRTARYLARKRKVGAPRKPETLQDIAKQLAGD
jgi:hypothetical protein